jgi:hypothetical protein
MKASTHSHTSVTNGFQSNVVTDLPGSRHIRSRLLDGDSDRLSSVQTGFGFGLDFRPSVREPGSDRTPRDSENNIL